MNIASIVSTFKLYFTSLQPELSGCMSACTKIKQKTNKQTKEKKNKTKIYGLLNLAHSGMKLRLDMAMCHPGTVLFSTVQNACMQNKNMVLLRHSIFKPY